jgi:ERCC4-type nuclease
VPIFLDTADYILSDSVGIERKYVPTGDLCESLRSGRLV